MVPDRIQLKEIAEIPFQVFDKLDINDVVIYVAHTYGGRSLEELSRQLEGRPTVEHLQLRVDYVRAHLEKALRRAEVL